MKILTKHISSIFYQRIHFPIGFENYSFLRCLVFGCARALKSLLTARKLPDHQKRTFNEKASVLMIVSSQNQKRILADICQRLGFKVNIIASNTQFKIDSKECITWDALFRSNFSVGMNFNPVWKSRNLLLKPSKKFLWLDLDKILRLRSSLRLAIEILQQGNYDMVMMANDHSFLQRLFLHASKETGVKSAYIQHALVSERFPKLDFDYAFLYGQETLRKYKVHEDTKVFITGMYEPKLTQFTRDLKRHKVVGIAVNKLDCFKKVEALAHELISRYNSRVLIRLHPNQSMSSLGFLDANIEFSQGSLDEYLQRIDFNISANTSFHLDSILRGVPSFYCELGSQLIDYYGFVQSGLVRKLSFENTYEEMCSFEVNKKLLRNYNNTNEGHMKIVEELKKILNGIS